MAGSMIGEIITDHRERMLNLKKYYPFFRLMDASFDQYKDCLLYTSDAADE